MKYAWVLLAGCAVAPMTGTAPAPLVGDTPGADRADRDCTVVLRGLERVDASAATWTWQGTIEVDAAAQLAPSLLYSTDGAIWHVAAATPSTRGATPGYARWNVALDHDVPEPGDPSPELQVVPYVVGSDGGRVFDHNRNSGDLDNYLLTAPDLAVWGAPSVCAPPTSPQAARLVFAADFTQHREGVLAPGGQVTIAYGTSRLAQCHEEQGGHTLWDITAHVRFDPGEELRDVSVLAGDVSIPVPPDTRTAVLWFEATNASGCHAWDSNFGANYPFDAATPPQWIGNADTLLTRDTSGDICGGAPAASGFSFDTWTRQQAAITNLCFEVYQPGMTDHDDPDLWEKLDVSLHWRADGDTAWQVTPVDFDRRTGNNARYAQSWRPLDPFRPYHCPDGTVTTTPDGYAQQRIDYYIVVNGAELRPEPGAAFAAQFQDYASDPWRAANCP